MLKKLFADSVKRNLLPMIFYLAAILYYAAGLLLSLLGVDMGIQDMGFIFACLMAFTGLFFQAGASDKKPVISILMTVIFCVLAYVCLIEFLGLFMAIVNGFDAEVFFILLAYATYLAVSVILIIFSLKQFKPNTIVFIALFVGLFGVVLEFVGAFIDFIRKIAPDNNWVQPTFSLGIFSIIIPACFFLGTFFFIKKEFSDGTEIKDVLKMKKAETAEDKKADVSDAK